MLRVAALLVVAAISFASVAADATACVNATNTACVSGRTCCQTEYSDSNYGCCMMENAVCCGANGPPLGYADPLPSWGVGRCCPAGTTCGHSSTGDVFCKDSSGGENPADTVCKPGASKPPSTTQPNVLIIGDSVSIGYEPPTAANLSDVAFVQHSPWDTRGGGAGATSYGRTCLDNLLLTSMGVAAKWDVIMFNFGLHNLNNDSAAEAQYAEDLANITSRLVATGSKILYSLTTPYMPDKTVGNDVVQQLNAIATGIMKKNNVPIVDLYSRVTAFCGSVYSTCSICRKDPCSYHYTPQGYEWISAPLANAIRSML